MKRFTTNGACVPELNYMVKTDELVSNIIQLIDDKQYFAINRARQYGKTTTLNALSNKIFEMRLYKQFLGDVVKVKNIS